MTARRHHYVPQCYLKGFCPHRAKPKLFVVDVKQLRTFSTPPANVAAERDFNAIDVEGTPTDALENDFAKFESDLSRSLERIIATRSLAEETDRGNLLSLIAVMAVKNPRQRENFRQFEERLMKKVLRLMTATPERWESQVRRMKEAGYVGGSAANDYEGMKNFVNRDQFNISTSTGHHLSIELPAIDSVLPFMFGRKWLLLRAPGNTTGFVTSDHPACLFWSDDSKPRGALDSPGHGLHGTDLVFPISNGLAVIGSFEIENEERDADQNMIARVNTAVISQSERQVYARDGEFFYLSPARAKIMRGVDLVKDQLLTERREGAHRAKSARRRKP